ncbi:hypothetical protein SALBM311S_01844 [Streptomyces alboniger]
MVGVRGGDAVQREVSKTSSRVVASALSSAPRSTGCSWTSPTTSRGRGAASSSSSAWTRARSGSPPEVSEAPLRTTSSGSRTETREARPVARFGVGLEQTPVQVVVGRRGTGHESGGDLGYGPEGMSWTPSSRASRGIACEPASSW